VDCVKLNVVGLRNLISKVAELGGVISSKVVKDKSVIVTVKTKRNCYRIVAEITIDDVIKEIYNIEEASNITLSKTKYGKIDFVRKIVKVMKAIREVPVIETKDISEDDMAKIISLVEVLKSAFFNYITELDKVLNYAVEELEKRQEVVNNGNTEISKELNELTV